MSTPLAAACWSPTAILWEGDNPAEHEHVTYRDLYERTCRLANALRKQGVKKGDRVTIYLPMIPEAAVAMLACARIGAIHSIVFGGFSPDSLVSRIDDCSVKIVSMKSKTSWRRSSPGQPWPQRSS